MVQKKDNLPVNTDPIIADGGTITYANEVIAIISGIAASEVEGIAGMVTAGGLGEIISKNRNITRGVKVEVGSEEVSVDLFTIVEYGQPIQQVASLVQENVRKSIESMTGLRVVRVDIHVQGVSFEKDKKETQSRLEAANIQHIAATGQDKKAKKAEKLEKGSKPVEPVVEEAKQPDPQPADELAAKAAIEPEAGQAPQPQEQPAEPAKEDSPKPKTRQARKPVSGTKRS